MNDDENVDKPPIKKDDWVCFYTGGIPVVARVLGRRKRESWESSDVLYTDRGTASIELVIEVRR